MGIWGIWSKDVGGKGRRRAGEVRLKDLAAGEVGSRWRGGRGTRHRGLILLYLVSCDLRLGPIVDCIKGRGQVDASRWAEKLAELDRG